MVEAYQIAITEPAGVNNTHKVYWHQTDYGDIEALNNYLTVEGNYTAAYYDGITQPQVVIDLNSWTHGALMDFDGVSNSATIMSAHTLEEVPLENTIGKVLIDYRTSEGQDDLFLPSYGQLVYMFSKYVEDINAVLSKVVDAEQIANELYWSSTERTGAAVWVINLYD